MNQVMVQLLILQDRIRQIQLLQFLSAAMMLRYSFDLDKEADAVEACSSEGSRG